MTKKILASFLGLTMALMMVPGMAQGQTVEDLQDQINDLLEQIAGLNDIIAALTGGTTPAAGVPAACAGITFTVDLSQGSTGNDVKCLQALLNTDPATQLATTGPGSPGSETTYFGPLTHGAVVNFQNQHAAQILTPIGLTAGTGYVGQQTRPVLNAMLTAVPECTVDADCLTGYGCVGEECVLLPEECTVDADCPAGFECIAETCEAETPVEPTEGWLTARWLPTPTGVTVNWGASGVAVGAIELKARDSAITVNRIDINFNGAPWQKINHLAIYDGDTLVKESVIDSSTVSEVTFGTNYRLRLTGLSVQAPLGGVKNLTVKVNAPTIPRTPGAMAMTVGTDAIRGIDTAGIYQYATITGTRSFTVAAAGLGARIETKINSGTPAEGFGMIDGDTATQHEVLTFDLVVTRNAARVRTVTVTLSTTTNINAVKLYDGSTAIGSETAAATTSFTDLEVDIAKDGTKTLGVEVEYAATTTAGSVTASVAAGDVAGVSANEETPTYTGSAAGNAIYFYDVVPNITLVSASRTLVADTTDKANAELVFKVTALGGDVFVSATTADMVASSTASSTSYNLDTTGLTATAGNSYRIAQDQSQTFTVSGYLDNNAGTAGFFRFFMSLFTWDITDGGTTNAWTNTNWMLEDIGATAIYLSD